MDLEEEKKEKVAAGTQLGKARYVVMDTELTGLNPKKDSIVSIGAVQMTGGRIDLNRTFYRLVKPDTALSAESIVIHGITPSEVTEQPGIGQVLSDFVDFCAGALLVGFCIDIDMEFVDREMKRLFGRRFGSPVIDIRAIIEWARTRGAVISPRLAPLPERYRLYDIARGLDIRCNGGHNALSDAFIAAQVFQRMIPALIQSGVANIGDLLAVCNCFKGGERYDIMSGISNF